MKHSKKCHTLKKMKVNKLSMLFLTLVVFPRKLEECIETCIMQLKNKDSIQREVFMGFTFFSCHLLNKETHKINPVVTIIFNSLKIKYNPKYKYTYDRTSYNY